jgi:hypothetical protein
MAKFLATLTLSDVARDGRTAVEAKLDAFEEKDLESIQ